MHGLSSSAVRSGASHERRWLTLATLCAAVLIAQLDTSVVNLAVRPIGSYFQSGIGPLQWVMDSYNLLYAVLLLTGGLLSDLYGRRLVFVAGAAVFTVASLLCAAAPTIGILIGARALAGVGAALLLPASLAIIRVVWPDHRERARALGIWTGCNGLALALGPTAGGLLLERFGWRSIFAVVIPVGIAAVAMARWTVPESADPQDRHFDLPAQMLGALALGGIALAAIESHRDLVIAGVALVVAVVSFAGFVRIEARRGSAALVPIDMFRIREFRGTVVATAGMTFGMYGGLFLLPLTWQSDGRLDAVQSGLALMPIALLFMLVSPLSGALTGLAGSRVMTAGGVAVIGCGLLLVGVSADWTSLLATEIGLGLTGLGMGLATGPLMGVAVGSVSAARSGTAAALINVARMIGATVGVAVLGTVFAFAQEATVGLRIAMLAGAAVQLSAAAVAWRTTRPQAG